MTSKYKFIVALVFLGLLSMNAFQASLYQTATYKLSQAEKALDYGLHNITTLRVKYDKLERACSEAIYGND